MTVQRSRSYTILSVATIIAGVVIASGILAFTYRGAVTKIETDTTTLTITTTATVTENSSTTTVISQGATYQVQSSYDCLAGHSVASFNVTTTSLFEGRIDAGEPGVTLYVATIQSAQKIDMGHPAAWIYSSGLTNSVGFNLSLGPGYYVLWTEGADLGCGATTITPLEQLTVVTVTQAITLTPL